MTGEEIRCVPKLEMGKYGQVAVLLALAGALAACGGGGSVSAATSPTAGEVMRCVVKGGGKKWPLSPVEPKGSPQKVATAFAVGPEAGHIGIYLSQRPVFTHPLAEAYDEFGEYHAHLALGGRALILLDPQSPKADTELAFRCVEG
jgi:hypothetical protein